jgi:hypothetical protein
VCPIHSEYGQAIEYLRNKGYTAEQVSQEMLKPVPITKQNIRRAARAELDNLIKNAVGGLLAERHISPEGKDLDKNHLDRSNFVIVKAEIDKAVNRFVGMQEHSRQEFSQEQLDKIKSSLSELIKSVSEAIFNG